MNATCGKYKVLRVTMLLCSLLPLPAIGADISSPLINPVYINKTRLVLKSSGRSAQLFVELVNRTNTQSNPFSLKIVQRNRVKIHETIAFPDGIGPRERARRTIDVSIPASPGQVCYLVQLRIPGETIVSSRWTERLACTYITVTPDAPGISPSGESTIQHQLPPAYQQQLKKEYLKR